MKLILNSAIKGMRGVMDGWVYRAFEGETIATRRPVFTRPPSASQLGIRERFQEAAVYARGVFDDEARKAVYVAAAKAAGRTTLWSLVVEDFLQKPVVKEIDLTTYAGAVGNLIKIRAFDDFEVMSVHVTIRDAAGNDVEDGLATKGDVRWTYVAQSAAPGGPLVIEARAMDRAENTAVLTAPWNP